MTARQTFSVLLVEDDPGDALVARLPLEDADPRGAFQVTRIERLGDAIGRISRDRPDVVLLDLGLPDASSIEAVTRLLSAAPDLPLIVLGGLDDERLALEAVLTGAQDYLIKGQSGCGAMRRAVRYAIERKRVERRLRFLARHDPLTGLANRVLFHDHLAQALHRLHGRQRLVGLIFIDLGGFKPINDRFGHGASDALLAAAALRMLGAVRRTDTVARIGGDEFTAILEGLRRQADAVRVGEKILAALREPFVVEGIEVALGASLGIALADRAERDPDTLLHEADAAMYRAKASGGGRVELYEGTATLERSHAPLRAMA